MLRFLLPVLALIVFVLPPNPAKAVHNGTCDGTLTGTPVVTDTITSSWHRCYANMQNAKVKFYGIYLCPSEPTLATYRTACDAVFESDAGQLVTFTSGEDIALPTNGAVSLSVGTYTYFAFRIGGKIQNKMVVGFDTDKSGKTGSGKWCYTAERDYVKAKTTQADAAVDCTTTQALAEANVGWASEESGYMCGAGGAPKVTTRGWQTNSFGKRSISYKVDLVDNEYTAQVGEACPNDSNAIGTIAPRTVSFQQIRNPATITPTTKSIKISMGFEGYSEVAMRDVSHGNCTGPNDCVVRLRSKAPEFIVDVQ